MLLLSHNQAYNRAYDVMEIVIKCTEKLTMWLQMRRYFCYDLDHSADKPMLCSTAQKTYCTRDLGEVMSDTVRYLLNDRNFLRFLFEQSFAGALVGGCRRRYSGGSPRRGNGVLGGGGRVRWRAVTAGSSADVAYFDGAVLDAVRTPVGRGISGDGQDVGGHSMLFGGLAFVSRPSSTSMNDADDDQHGGSHGDDHTEDDAKIAVVVIRGT